MNGSGRFDKESVLATGAKAVSILLVVAIIALFTTHAPLPIGEVALVPDRVAIETPPVKGVAIASPVARTQGEAAKRAAVPAR